MQFVCSSCFEFKIFDCITESRQTKTLVIAVCATSAKWLEIRVQIVPRDEEMELEPIFNELERKSYFATLNCEKNISILYATTYVFLMYNSQHINTKI